METTKKISKKMAKKIDAINEIKTTKKAETNKTEIKKVDTKKISKKMAKKIDAINEIN